MAKPRYWVVIPAAGIGKRMGTERPKQYLPLAGATVLEHSIHVFLNHLPAATVLLALQANDPYWPLLQLHAKAIQCVSGGQERCHSVLNALHAAAEQGAADDDWVLVHDAARPCLQATDLHHLIDQLRDHTIGGLLAVPVRDTLKRSNSQHAVIETLDRSQLWHAQTPQMFRFRLLHTALSACLAAGLLPTDEAAAMEHHGYQPLLIEGRASNIKITWPDDLLIAEQLLRSS